MERIVSWRAHPVDGHGCGNRGCGAVGVAVHVSSLLGVDSRLYEAFIAEGAGTTAREQALFDALSGASHLAAVLLAFFLGGLLAGRIAPSFPGSNGAASAGRRHLRVRGGPLGPVDLGAYQQPRRGLHARRKPQQPGGVRRGLLRCPSLRGALRLLRRAARGAHTRQVHRKGDRFLRSPRCLGFRPCRRSPSPDV